MSKFLLAALAVIVVLVVLGVSSYNGLVGKQQGVDAAWAQVSNQYQRRADLVANLVKTAITAGANYVEGYKLPAHARPGRPVAQLTPSVPGFEMININSVSNVSNTISRSYAVEWDCCKK